MAEPKFAAADDDLPRTLRRERDAQREAREREQREREAQMQGPADPGPSYAYQEYGGYGGPHPPGVVNRFEVPFGHLVLFFLKAVVAGIPALLLLTALLYAGGQALKAFLPGFRHFEIVVRTPEPTPVAQGKAEPAAGKAAEPARPGPAKR